MKLSELLGGKKLSELATELEAQRSLVLSITPERDRLQAELAETKSELARIAAERQAAIDERNALAKTLSNPDELRKQDAAGEVKRVMLSLGVREPVAEPATDAAPMSRDVALAKFHSIANPSERSRFFTQNFALIVG